ncbi:hypothetical protein PV08_08978 [Exophiala spinifera]|uniref:FAD-binding FR-type domain-containing protein n=1 Tax=Exophiala spinifera TaxID=91928 RepID=A0A0D1ZLS0_9EURO|nr:uncharacterized protein PV08_08978 [Exophiala spinifera]KIW13787.1 hypothetical protein PV08_08978 [Exophiala spinifera]
MDMSIGGGSSSFTPLNDSGVDFSNETQAFDFLGDILDDTYLQVVSNQYARYFWYGVVTVIGLATIFNWSTWLLLCHRLKAAQHGNHVTTRPNNIFSQSIAALTAVARESSYPQLAAPCPHLFTSLPTLGSTLLIASYLAFILALEFVNGDYPGAQHYQALSIRASWLAVSQVPLLVLLAGKYNWIGLLTGVNYRRLNIYHRWIARGLLLLSTLHFGLESGGWAKYGLMALEWKTDTCPPTGMGAYAILLWMNITTLAPFRNLSYEFFVLQHLLTFFGFIIAIMLHLPTTALYTRVYIWIPIGFYLFDRTVRTLRSAWNNAATHKATLIALDGTATKVRVPSRRVKRWNSGAHVLLAIPKLGVLQSHPATIMSTPSSHGGDLIFLLRAHRGFTRQLASAAGSSSTLLQEPEAPQRTYFALIDGPYNSSCSDFAAYDMLTLVAAGTGVSFTTSVLLDLAHRASKNPKLPLRVINFIWVVKRVSHASWISDELQMALELLKTAGIDLHIRFFVTCDPTCMDTRESGSQETCKCSGGDTGMGEKSTDCCCNSSPIITPVSPSDSNPHRYEWATFTSGRPNWYVVLTEVVECAKGESAIGACGPPTFCASVRNTVVRISDHRAVNKGSGAQGIYLHVESSY